MYLLASSPNLPEPCINSAGLNNWVVPTSIQDEKPQRSNTYIYHERSRVLNTFRAECLWKNSVHQLCPYAFSPGRVLLARLLAHSFARWRRKMRQGHAKTSEGEEMKNTDWWTEGLKFLSEQDGKRLDDTEKRDLESRVIHFYGSKTHYHLIRAHTFLSVWFNMRAWRSKLLF